jgi:tagaturonate reductase
MVRETFTKINAVLDTFMPLITPLGVAAGFIFAGSLLPLKPLVTYFFAYVTLMGALGLNAGDFKKALSRPLPLAAIFLCAHVLVPGVTALAARLCFPGKPDILSGYVLLMAIPTAVAGYIWTSIYHGDEAVTLTMILIDTLLAPVVTPLTVRIFANSALRIDTTGMIISLLLMVVIPSVAGVTANQISHNRMRVFVTPIGKPFSKIALFAVIAVNTAQVADKVSFSFTLLPIFALNAALAFLGFLSGALIAKLLRADRRIQVSMTFACGMRNISAALVLAINFFPPESALPVVIGIVLQQTLAAFSGWVFFRKNTQP